MLHKFKEMLAKKRDLKPHEKAAKLDVLKDLKDVAHEALSDRLGSQHGMKKVSVMSDSPEGLQAGLEKAHDMVSGQDSDQGQSQESQMDQQNMMSEGGEVDPSKLDGHDLSNGADPDDDDDLNHEQEEDMDLDAIKAQIAHLMELQKQQESKLK